MRVSDVMTPDVVTVHPDTPVHDIAVLLQERRISAVPVVDQGGKVIGIVSEGDLMRRAENETQAHRSWWLDLFSPSRDRLEEFTKARGNKARHVMTLNPVSVTPDATLADTATLLEKHRIKRVPVIDGDKLVGIVSRANLLHGLTARPSPHAPANPDDRAIREAILRTLSDEIGISPRIVNVIVTEGAVQLWGTVDDDTEERALVVAAETTPGVRSVESRLGRVPAWAYAY